MPLDLTDVRGTSVLPLSTRGGRAEAAPPSVTGGSRVGAAPTARSRAGSMPPYRRGLIWMYLVRHPLDGSDSMTALSIFTVPSRFSQETVLSLAAYLCTCPGWLTGYPRTAAWTSSRNPSPTGAADRPPAYEAQRSPALALRAVQPAPRSACHARPATQQDPHRTHPPHPQPTLPATHAGTRLERVAE